MAYAEHTSSSWLSLLYMWMLLWQLEGFSSYLRKGISEANQRAIIIPSRNHFLVVLNTSHSWLSLVAALSNLSWFLQGEESWFRSSFGWTSFWNDSCKPRSNSTRRKKHRLRLIQSVELLLSEGHQVRNKTMLVLSG